MMDASKIIRTVPCYSETVHMGKGENEKKNQFLCDESTLTHRVCCPGNGVHFRVLDGPDCNDYMVSLADDADRDGVCDHFEWFFNQHDYDVEIEATYGYKKCREELEYLRKRYNGIAGNRDWRDIGQLSGDPCKIDNCIRIPYTHEFNPPPLTWTGEEHIGSRNFEPLYYGAKETALLNHCYDDNFQPKSIGQAGQCNDLWRNSNQTDTDGDGIGDVCDTDVSYNDRRLYYKDQARLEDDIELIECECLDECGSLGVLPEMTTVEGELTYFEWKTTGMQIEKEGNDYFRKSKIEEDLSALGICTCPEDMSKNQCMERDYPCYTNIANGYPSPDIPIPYWRRFETAELNSSYWQKMLDPRFAHSHTNEGTLILKPRFADPDHGFHINNVSWDPNENADICNTGGFCKKGDWFGMRYVKGWDDINAIQSSWNKAYYNQNGQITGYDVEEEFKVNCVCGLNIKPFEMRQWPDFHIMPETRTRYVSRVNKVCIGNRINEIDDTAYTFSVRYDTITGRMNGSQSRPFAGYNISNTPADSFGTATGLLLVPPAQKTSDMDDNNANYSIFDEFKEQTGKGTEEIITMDFIFGGEKHNGALSGDLWASFSHPDINNEQFDRWIRIEPDDGVEGPKLRSPRTVYLQDINRLYVFGGWNSDNIWSHDIHYFDLDDMKWHEAGSLDISRLQTGYDVFYHQSKKKIIIFGGSFGDFPTLLAYNYMPSTGKTKMIYQWGIPGINMPWPRREPGVTLRELKDEIVLFGGKIGKEPIYKNDTWSLDLNTGFWERIDSHSINLPSPRANAVLMPGQGDNLHMVSGTHYGEMIFETAWTMGGRMKGWEKVPTSVKALVVNDENGVESNYTGKIEHSYRIAGIEHIDIDDMDIHDAEMIKVHLVEDGSDGDLDIEVVNQQGEVVARGADVTVGSIEKHPVASFLAVPGVQYTVRVVYNGYIPEGDYVYYKLVASGAQTDLRSTEFGFMTGGFDISNGYLFVTTAKGLHIYRIMDDGTLYGGGMGGKPMFIPMQMPQDVVADWPYAYVADLERGLMVVDMTRFETGDDPVITSINLGSHMCYSIDKYGDKLYLAMGWMGVYIADVSTPSSLKITGNKWLCDFAYRVNNYGSKLMVSSLIKGIQLLDIKASGMLKGISSYRTQGMALDAKGHGSNIYVNNFGPGMEIISLSDMEDLDKAGEYEGSSIPVDAQIWGNAAIVHIDGVGVASFELIDDLAAVPFYNN